MAKKRASPSAIRNEARFQGALFIGDPHLEGRQPGFRKDDYPQVILEKLEWALCYAHNHQLVPVLLGDLFDKPRDNANWLLNRLLQILPPDVLTVFGNHDVHYQPELTEDDSLTLLVNSGRLRVVSETSPWVGLTGDRTLVIAGSSYRQALPKKFDSRQCVVSQMGMEAADPIVVWITHHDILIPGYEEGRVKPAEIPGVDLIINGHIHRRLETVVKGKTSWMTPGNISRRTRSDASRSHVPSVLELRVNGSEFTLQHVEIPHRPFEEVFHDAVIESVEKAEASAFVTGLAELQARRTESGAGLMEFLKENIEQFEAPVAAVIWDLARAVTEEGTST